MHAAAGGAWRKVAQHPERLGAQSRTDREHGPTGRCRTLTRMPIPNPASRIKVMDAESKVTMGDRLEGACGNRGESFQTGLMKMILF